MEKHRKLVQVGKTNRSKIKNRNNNNSSSSNRARASSKKTSSKHKVSNHRANPGAGRIKKREARKMNPRQRANLSNQDSNRARSLHHRRLSANKNRIRNNFLF